MASVEVLRMPNLLAEVTSYLTLSELLQLRVVSTELRTLVDSDDLWERRFLADANTLTKAILFSWIQHVVRATEARRQTPPAPDSTTWLSHSWWIFKLPSSTATDFFVNTSSTATVRERLRKRLEGELRKGHRSLLFNPCFWPDQSLPSGLGGGRAAEVESPTIAQDYWVFKANAEPSVFQRLCLASRDVGMDVACRIGFEAIRQVLFEPATVVECLNTARFLGNLKTPDPAESQSTEAPAPPGQGLRHRKQIGRTVESKRMNDLRKEENSLMEATEPLFHNWNAVYRFCLTPLEENHPFVSYAQESKSSRPHQVAVLWHEWREYQVMLRCPPKSVRRKNALPSELIPGIQRSAFYFSNLILLLSRRARVASDWMVCLSWLTNKRSELNPFITRLVNNGPMNPILLLPSSPVRIRSRRSGRWIAAVLIGIGCCIHLGIFIHWRLMLVSTPILLLVSVVASTVTEPLRISTGCAEHDATRDRKGFALNFTTSPQVKQRWAIFSTDFAPLEEVSLTHVGKLQWIMLICLERWKHNHVVSIDLGLFFLSCRIPAMIFLWFLTYFVTDGAFHDWERELSIITGAAFIQLSWVAFRRESNEFMEGFYRFVGTRYPPPESEIISYIKNNCQMIDERKPSDCKCGRLLCTDRPPPPLAHLLSQITHVENSAILIIAIGTYALLTVYPWLQEETSAPASALFLHQLIMPHVLWQACIGLALGVSFFVNVCYWYLAVV